MEETVKQNIKEVINHSGFPLEHEVGLILRQHGWSIITNRYYIDDIRGTEREVDVIAYKIHTDDSERIQYITTLIVSCKKSDKKTWCFLTREADENDGNTDWTPLHFCTTDKRLEYMTNNHREMIIKKYKSNIATRHLYDFTENVFAYEQLRAAKDDNEKKQKGAIISCGNDDIYNSIITSIKAVGYEKKTRMERYQRHKYKRYYTFHILSIFDGDMVKDFFDESKEQHIEEIKGIKYLNRHIVNNVDNFYIVNFIHKNDFDYRLKLFDYLHSENCRVLPKLLTAYYTDIFQEKGKADLLWKDFSNRIQWAVKYTISNILLGEVGVDELKLSYGYNNEEKILNIEIDNFYLNEDTAKQLNEEEWLHNHIKQALKLFYRYDGLFQFTESLLF